MAAAAENATERVDQLILLTERLTHLVALGAQAFEARRPQDAAAYVDETGRLANHYRHESARIRGNPALIAGVRTKSFSCADAPQVARQQATISQRLIRARSASRACRPRRRRRGPPARR